MDLTTKQGVAFLTAALAYVREELDSEAQVQKIMSLLIVHAKPGIKQPEIAEMVGNIAQSSVSRALMDMSHLTQARETGPALIIQRPDPEFRRRNVVETTDRGNTFIDNMVKAGLSAAGKIKG